MHTFLTLLFVFLFLQGIVRIHLLEAENLASKDNYVKGVISGKSDPYAVLRVGTQTFTSHHVDNNLNPQWREMYEVRERERDVQWVAWVACDLCGICVCSGS